MINIELKDVHIGHEIQKRVEELGISKSEFARRIGVQQQHVNRILERDTMETKKLVSICRALDFNFFALYCQFPTSVNAYLAAVALGDGDANNNIGDAVALSQIEVFKERIIGLEENKETLKDQIRILKDTIDLLKTQLNDKNEMLNLLKNSK